MATITIKIAKDFTPTLRIHVPVIVRGQEDAGVQFWGISKTIYDKLVELCAPDQNGDITDLENGFDINVTSKVVPSKQYHEIDVMPRPKSTPVGDATVREAIKNQLNVINNFSLPDAQLFEKYITEHINLVTGGTQTKVKYSPEHAAEISAEEDAHSSDEEPVDAEAKHLESVIAGQSVTEPSDSEDDQFDALFATKS